jgi:hypothetical protein
MPYRETQWPPAEFEVGDWVPETDLSGWVNRHSQLRDSSGVRHDSWVNQTGLTEPDKRYLEQLAPLSSQPLESNERLKHLLVLGADIGSVRRDGYFYANFLEQLKQAAPISAGDAAADEVADNVVERMKTMGFTSANLREPYGGPPDRKSLRPWKGVMKWLLGLIRKAGQFLLKAMRAFAVLAAELAVDAASKIAVGFSVGFSLADIQFEIELAYLTDNTKWEIFRRFGDAMLGETEKLLQE